jgi:hypothetical protein
MNAPNTLPNDNLNDDKIAVPERIFVRHPYNYDTAEVSQQTGLSCPEETLTQQHQAKEADINYIVQQFGVTGMLPNSVNLPTYQDFDAVFDYQQAQNLIIEANAEFLKLPSEARAAFNHDPGQLISYLENNPDPQMLLDLGIAEVFKDNRAPREGSVSEPEQ